MEKIETDYYLWLPIPTDLKKRTAILLDEIRGSETPKQYVSQLADIIYELTEHGLNYYFYHSMELAEVGFIHRKAVKIGLKTTQKGVFIVVKRILKILSNKQLIIISNFIDDNIKKNTEQVES